MVVNKVSISMEGAKGAGQESTVLSRVRLLESGENSEGGTIATRENVRAVIHLSGATRTEATKHPSASAKLGGQELANATQERAKFVTAPRTSIRSSRESVGNQTRSSSKMDHTDLNSLISRESLHFSKGHHARQLPKVDSTVLNSSVLGEAEVPAYPTKSYHGQSPPKVNRSLPSSRTSHEPVEVFTNSSKGSQGRSSPRVDRTFSNTKPHTLTNASAHLANVFQGHPSPKVDFTISNSSSSREPVEVSADLAKGYQSRPSLKVVHTTFHTPVRRIETVQAREVRPISDVTAISPLDGFLKTNLPSKVDAVESHGANRSRRALSASPLRHARNVSPAPSRGRQVGEHDSNVTKNDPRDKTLRSSSLPRPSIDVTDTSGSEKSSSEGVRKRKDSPTMVSHVRAREKSNNVSQFFILKRHHWENRDDKNERPSDAPNGSREDSGRTESNSEPMMKNWKSENQRHVEELQWNALPQRKSADAELSWPSDNLEASRMGKPGTTAYTSSQVENSFPRVGRSYPVGQLGTTLGDFRLQNTCQKPEFNELKRNLNAASVVMYEEKASSAENSSSSGRSSLSHQELGVIAAKAFQLSMVQADTQAMRRENSPLHQILAAKRTRKISKEGKQSQEKEQPRENVVFAYSSAQRLSERLTRAERFTALKRTSTNFHAQNDDTFAGLDASSSSPSPEKSKHPVFGYRKQVVDTKDLQADETFNIPSEPSCVRRSKHLSKIMQQKADHFAACSPTQRNKHESGPTAPEHASRDPNPYFERIFAPRVSQPYRSGQAVKHNEETNSIAREHAQYRERNYRPDARHSSQRHNGFVKETKNQTMPRQSAATGDDKKFSHLQLRFNYPPGSRTNPGQAPNQREKEPFSTFDSRRSRYNTDEPLHEESLKDFAHGKRQQQTLGNKSGRIVPREENRDTEQPTILASEAVLEHDGIDDYSEGTSSSDEERARPEAPQRLPYSTWMASGSTSKVTTFPENFTKDIKKASPTELPNLRYDVREASGNSDKAFPRPAIAESRKYMQLGEPISASQTSSADEDKKGPGSHILTDFSENGNGTCGELSGHDTYTGSLNKHEIRMGSSDSSATTRPDAFLWLHQKYGTQNPTVADSTIPKRASWTTIQVKTNTDIVKNNVDNRAQVIEKNKESDDDDIFFGLEEEETAVGGESRKQEKTAGRNPVRPSRIRTDRSQFEASNTSATTTATQQPSSKPMLTPQTQLTHKDEVKKHSGKTINADETNKSVTSDISSSLIAEKGRKMSRYGPNTVDTIMEEAPVSASVDEDDPSLEEEPIQDENKPSNSVLRNISAIVNSLKHVCTIPQKMSDIGACAVNTKMKCEEKISEAWVGIGEEVDDDATKTTFGTSEPVGNTTEDMLNDAERRIWAAWDKREKVVLTNNSDKSIDAPFHETDDSRLLKDSSSSNNMLSEVDHQERRIEAQNQLLHHAENAMELYGYKADHLDNISTESSVSQLPKPITMIKVHEPSPSKPSFDQRAMLETFSSHLKKEGVEVLKLSRRNKWQVRYLTVSREVTRLDTQEFFTGNIGQCPKALLWPKQRKGRNNSVSSIKGNGRGGLLFAQLTQVELSSSNELYDRHLPRKLKAAFPSYAGAVLDYCFKRGNRKLHFCFKTKLDAEAFVTTMLIIKEAAERMASKGSKKIGSCPTESLRTATKSFDSS